MKRLSLVIFLLHVIISLSGQEVSIQNLRGQIVDASSNEPVPFANVRYNKTYYGTSTNLEGRFELKLQSSFLTEDNKLVISCIGYKTKTIYLSGIDTEKYQTFKLAPETHVLDEIVIRSNRAIRKEENRAKTIIMNMIDKIPYNKMRSKFMAKTFYRHYCKEDTTYVRLTEAAISLSQNDGKADFVQLPVQRFGFQLAQLRRSFDHTAFSKLSHPPISLNYLISNDINNFEYHNPIRKKLNNYNFSIKDTTTYQRKPVIVINFESIEKGSLSYSGDLYIKMDDYALIRSDFEEVQISTNQIDSIRAVTQRKTFYNDIEGKYYVDRFISDVKAVHFNMTEPQEEPSVTHESHVEMMVNELIPKNKNQLPEIEPSEEELREIKYDSSFWHSYTVLQATPLEDKIINDLSSKVSLEKQFESINQLSEGVKSLVSSAECQKLLAPYEESPILLTFWSRGKVPNYYETIPSPELKKLIKKGKIQFLMIALDDNEEKWLETKEIYGLENPFVEHKRLDLGYGQQTTNNFFSEYLPDYLIVNRNGEILDQTPPLPNASDIKEYYSNLFQEIKK